MADLGIVFVQNGQGQLCLNLTSQLFLALVRFFVSKNCSEKNELPFRYFLAKKAGDLSHVSVPATTQKAPGDCPVHSHSTGSARVRVRCQ